MSDEKQKKTIEKLEAKADEIKKEKPVFLEFECKACKYRLKRLKAKYGNRWFCPKCDEPLSEIKKEKEPEQKKQMRLF